jgi:hypothetical protein
VAANSKSDNGLLILIAAGLFAPFAKRKWDEHRSKKRNERLWAILGRIAILVSLVQFVAWMFQGDK